MQLVPKFHLIYDKFFKNSKELEGGEFFHMSSPKYSQLLKDIITSGEVKEDKHKALMHRMYYSFGHKDKLSEKAQKYKQLYQ